MKLIITYLLVLFSLIICRAQENTKRKKMIPKVNNKFEKFDLVNYNQRKRKEITREVKNDTLSIFMDTKAGYSIGEYPLDGFFNVTRIYYINTNIETKGVSFINGSSYGIWYEFDEEGNLVKEINTDEGYKFGWQQVIDYCEKKEINLTRGYKEFDGYQTEILKQEENDKKIWVISYLVSPVLICKETLDGVTGKLLNSEELEFINH